MRARLACICRRKTGASTGSRYRITPRACVSAISASRLVPPSAGSISAVITSVNAPIRFRLAQRASGSNSSTSRSSSPAPRLRRTRARLRAPSLDARDRVLARSQKGSPLGPGQEDVRICELDTSGHTHRKLEIMQRLAKDWQPVAPTGLPKGSILGRLRWLRVRGRGLSRHPFLSVCVPKTRSV
jgi:hypothetical protein